MINRYAYRRFAKIILWWQLALCVLVAGGSIEKAGGIMPPLVCMLIALACWVVYSVTIAVFDIAENGFKQNALLERIAKGVESSN